MKKKIRNFIILTICVLGIGFIYSLPFSILKAKGNSGELTRVYLHYLLSFDHEKREAAKLVLANMEGHYCYTNGAIDSFSTTIKSCDSIMKEAQMNKIWKGLANEDNKKRQQDLHAITSDLLISDIDYAIDTWHTSPWKKEVSFDTFRSFILPYRVMNEKVEKGWRDYLKNKYQSITQGTTDLKRAFFLVHDSISRKIKRAAYDYPYQLNPLEMKNIQKGSCLQRCIYEVAVMRALGIPATIDGIDCWSNYSKNGHTWVALVAQDGTYTVAEDDTMARKGNPIDASIFKLKKPVSANFPCDTTFQKRCAKILRYHFEAMTNEYDDPEAAQYIYERFRDRHVSDISTSYGFTSNYTIAATQSEYAYLCVYRIGKGWHPITYTKVSKGKYTFRELGDSCVYLPAIYRNEKLMPLGNPFKMIKGKAIPIVPSQKQKETITLNRKYPMVNNFYTEWARLEGSVITASSNKNFKETSVLWSIDKTPVYKNIIKLTKRVSCKYIRFQAPEGIKAPFAEIAFFCGNKLLKATPTSEDATELEKCIDGDYFSMPKIQNNAYQIIFELKEQACLDKLLFITKNDGNYIISGHSYTLLYYDKGWKTLASQTATADNLSFTNVPVGAFLLLKDNNGGIENRPFVYQNGKQEWW